MPFARAILATARLRCPSCRAGRMSRAWWSVLQLHDDCPACGLPFMPGRGEFTGAIEITTYLTALAGLVGIVLILPADAWTLAAWVILFGVVVPLVAYRQLKALWVGVMVAARPWGGAGDPPHVAPVAMPATPWDE
jgi:uncharacterized protein (DUF983 family)